MPKAVIWVLIGIGFLFLLLGVFSRNLFLLGLLMVAAGLYFGLGPQGVLRKDQVLDSWATLIEKGQGKAGQLFQDTEGFIGDSKAPSIRMERKEIAPGFVKGIIGTRRDFLIITDQENFRLKRYQIFINSRDYGDNLDISWHLTYRPTLLQAIASLLPYVSVVPKTLSDLDLFDEQDLRAYVTNAHHCLLKAVEKVMVELQQDPSKIERKSRGFLGIS